MAARFRTLRQSTVRTRAAKIRSSYLSASCGALMNASQAGTDQARVPAQLCSCSLAWHIGPRRVAEALIEFGSLVGWLVLSIRSRTTVHGWLSQLTSATTLVPRASSIVSRRAADAPRQLRRAVWSRRSSIALSKQRRCSPMVFVWETLVGESGSHARGRRGITT